MKNLVLYILVFLLLASVGVPEIHYKKFKAWYNEHKTELSFHCSAKDYRFILDYRPKEINVLKAIHDRARVTSGEIKKLNSNYDAFYEFSFKIEREGVQDLLVEYAENEEQHTALTFYLMEQVFQDFQLKTNVGVQLPIQCSYENHYGAAPYIKIHLVFEKNENAIPMQITYDDQLFGNGKLKFDISRIIELKIPKIK